MLRTREALDDTMKCSRFNPTSYREAGNPGDRGANLIWIFNIKLFQGYSLHPRCLLVLTGALVLDLASRDYFRRLSRMTAHRSDAETPSLRRILGVDPAASGTTVTAASSKTDGAETIG